MNTCPNCHTKIYNPSASFCYKCGERLGGGNDSNDSDFNKLNLKTSPDKTVKDSKINFPQRTIEHSNIQVKDSSDKVTKRWNFFVVGINALSILFLIASLGIFFRSSGLNLQTSYKPVISVNSIEIDDAMADLFQGPVLKSSFFDIVPKSVDFYAESTNLEDFTSNFLSDTQKAYLEETYELKLEDLLVFMKPDYAYVKSTSGSEVAVLRTSGFDFFERTYSKYQENKRGDAPVYTKRVGEFLVISEAEDFINLMDDVTGGVEPALSSDSAFSSAVASVDGSPLFFEFSFSNEYTSKNLESDLKTLNLGFLYDDILKANSDATYVLLDSGKYLVKPL